MKTYFMNATSLFRSLVACLLLLIGGALQAQAASQTVLRKNIKQAEDSFTFLNQKALLISHLSLTSSFSEVTERSNVSAGVEIPIYPFELLEPREENLRVNIYPQPAAGHSGEIRISFNQTLTQEIEITIQDMDGRVYYTANHPAENQLVLQVGHHLPILPRGNYQLTAISERLVARHLFLVR